MHLLRAFMSLIYFEIPDFWLLFFLNFILLVSFWNVVQWSSSYILIWKGIRQCKHNLKSCK